MAKENITQYDTNPANNTDIDGVNIAESCPPSGINDAIRQIMAHHADINAGNVAYQTLKIDNFDLTIDWGFLYFLTKGSIHPTVIECSPPKVSGNKFFSIDF